MKGKGDGNGTGRGNRNVLRWISGTGALGLALATMILVLSDSSLGQSGPSVGIALTATNQVTISINTGITNLSYEVYSQPTVAGANWTLIASGAEAQTNVTAATDQSAAGFFKVLFLAAVPNDVDGDGVENWQDAQPYNSAVGILSVTIDSPLNGADLQ